MFHQIQLIRLVCNLTDCYKLSVRENRVTIKGSAASGVFYGVQTQRSPIKDLRKI